MRGQIATMLDEESGLKLDESWVTFELLPNYAVSNYGRVMNVQRNRDLTPCPDGNGYMRVALYHKGVRHDSLVHRLVAKAFFVDYQEGFEVKHINGNFEDNTVLNLELGVKKARVAEEVWI